MPGVASLAAGQYYAHPRNQFWDVMGALFGAGRDLPYAQRLARLRTRGVALWDVLAECERPGSLDSDIRHEKPNDIAGLLRDHPHIRALVFNGQPAARLFRRHFPALLPQVRWVVMPSTSPAHATRTVAAKQKAWSKLLSFV
jgi:hypoxanthine-DNA glycosylase